MIQRLKIQAGRSVYRLRKQTVEPAIGIIKSVMGFRQFSLPGVDKTISSLLPPPSGTRRPWL